MAVTEYQVEYERCSVCGRTTRFEKRGLYKSCCLCAECIARIGAKRRMNVIALPLETSVQKYLGG